MANVQQTQAFYGLTLEQASAPTSAILCNAIPGLKTADQQIFEARGQHISLHRITESADRTERTVTTVLDQDVFGIVRGVTAFRIPGTSTDQLIVSSDSGRVSVINYDAEQNRFNKVHLETYGKSGVRRTIPGQYLASDTRGRCIMLASAEKNKVVYMMNRNADGTIQISSPHEANQWGSLCFAVCALDTGWEPPVFAALEVDYTEAESDPTGTMYEKREKQLVYYTVDLGLNHVVKSWSDTVDYTANMIFGVPGGQDGPSGVLVCAEDRIYYRHDKHASLSIPIPRRKGPTEDPNRKRIIVAGCLHLAKTRHEFFFLLQTEDGDVFKLSMAMEEDAQGRTTANPERIILKYYDTFPVARQMLLHKKGYLYIATENGNSQLFHIDDLADDLEFEPHNTFTSDDVSPDPGDSYEPLYFQPRELTMTHLAVDIPGLHPLLKTKVDNLTNEDAPQVYAIQGTGNKSQFKTIRHGLDVEVLINNSMGNVPYDNIWTFKHRSSDEHHKYLLLSSSYGDLTIACSIGDSVEQIESSPFLENRATVHAQQMGDATLVQVHARGIRSILESGAHNEWQSPAHRTVVVASANERQLLLALSSAELAFFFMGDDGILNQLEEMPEMSGKITALSVGQTPRGRQQAKYAVVGCDDCTIRVLSIELDSPLEPRSVQALSAIPTSLEVVEMLDPASNTTVNVVHIGLQSGLYLRAVIDETTGELGDVRTKFLGTQPPRLCPVEVNDQDCILACSSRPWLGFNHPQTDLYTVTPLITEPINAARSFISPDLSGLCAIQGSSLLIFTVPSIEGRLSHSTIDLAYTPRSMTRNPWYPVWYVAQSDGNALSKATRDQLRGKAIDDDDEATALEKHLGLPRGAQHWASCIQAVDPVTKNAVVSTVELAENEAALCCTCVAFESRDWEVYLAVGTGQHMQPGTGVQAVGYVHIYKLVEDGTKLEFVHKTKFDQPVYTVLAFNGRLALGVGNELFIYDMGIKAMLRKARGQAVPNQIVSLEAQGNRIVCGDVSEGITYVVYKPKFNRMIPFVDDVVQRWTTCTTMVDYETAAGGDKFGNLWVVRCPEQPSQEADEEGAGGFIMNERSYLNGAPYRLDLRAHYFCQDIPTSMQRTALVAGGQEVLFWSGLQGTLGMLVPFVTREDVEFFTQLEQQMRAEDPPLAGRDHLMYRSYYVPVKGVIDGDLCERFMHLSYDSKQKIAAEVDRGVKEIEKKIQEMRTRVAF
ncbi:Pre-mRNA-splicing factor rse1 [Fulvia fulva]|uniref:Pre-mRNA-splicing factor rse1 n=1 Tax=Passalora fulva TaxID=5499 RepID=A0A9Q8LAU5_PASFU|nr:Pre-mRNA-splicing factor rse1 [Fulvia fulva]KAK4631909.1 Pre-mRNA-splicing factor rse1 [Fulvia fulva]KAK4632777.1 Pre-mRNA-splicing factor rse1 [Fulvia fulva]UJO13358.1 Pre-mRNA-splicing factor rse1 [Fulvia fulva]WPV11003.1 Pre-mRNA-splicing factor rse1 [Fulvia fulva]WPV26192.1 Pre-mRNA-splicing factor rse1 [Fulvia fulva]